MKIGFGGAGKMLPARRRRQASGRLAAALGADVELVPRSRGAGVQVRAGRGGVPMFVQNAMGVGMARGRIRGGQPGLKTAAVGPGGRGPQQGPETQDHQAP